MSLLFTPITLRGLAIRNRIWVSPMCQYSSVDGLPNDWHLVHLGARAVGGAGVVITEATAVVPEGRISPQDTGIWNDEQAAQWSRIAAFISGQGAVPAIQLAHAGRKGSVRAPSLGGGTAAEAEGGWTTVGPSPTAFNGYAAPRAMTTSDIADVVEAFRSAARRGLDAGFEIAEVHAGHGYLLHQFMSPLANERADDYGGSFDDRVRLTLEVAEAVRDVWPEHLPVLTRISATDWVDGGWDLDQSVELARQLKGIGIDLIDVSTAGVDPRQQIVLGPGYQVPFARAIRERAQVPTAAVGLITEPEQAERILAAGDADVILMAREFLRDPQWPLRAAAILGDDVPWPVQYERAKP